MPTTCCLVPDCCFNKCQKYMKKRGDRSLFTVQWPESAKSEEERLHRLELRKFVLSVRDPTKDNKILHMLHKESAAICSYHFRQDDILHSGAKRRLRVGAIPCLNLPRPNRRTPVQTTPKDIKIIIGVKENPCLYDKSRKRASNKKLRKAAWKTVSEITMLSVKECRQKWKSLRDKYEEKRAVYKRFGYPKYVTKDSRLMLLLSFLEPFCEPISSSPRVKPLTKAVPTEATIRTICEQLSSTKAAKHPIIAVEITDCDVKNHEAQGQKASVESSDQAMQPVCKKSRLQNKKLPYPENDTTESDHDSDENLECDEPTSSNIIAVKEEASEILESATEQMSNSESLHDDLFPPSIWSADELPNGFEENKNGDDLFLQKLLPAMETMSEEAKLRFKTQVIGALRNEMTNIDFLTNDPAS